MLLESCWKFLEKRCRVFQTESSSQLYGSTSKKDFEVDSCRLYIDFLKHLMLNFLPFFSPTKTI